MMSLPGRGKINDLATWERRDLVKFLLYIGEDRVDRVTGWERREL